MKQHLSKLLKMTAVAGALGISVGQAALLTNQNYDNTSQTAFAVSSVDLVDAASTSSLLSVVGSPVPNNLGNYNDGSNGGIAYFDSTYTLTFNLNTTVNTLGYDITSISTITGWQDERLFQNYSIDYRFAGGSTYFSLGSFANTPVAAVANGSLQLIITDTNGAVLSGVDSIRFNMNLISGGAGLVGSAFREIDVFGTATVVPEPSTYALLSLAGIVFLLVRARRLIAR
jgi:hypothetical protein